MSLAASIQKANHQIRGLEAVLIQLSAEDREALVAAVEDPAIGHTAIVRGLREVGVSVTEASVRRWRENRTVTLEEAA
ncbi:MAG: hypothetical protein ACTHJ9_06340 [Rhodanobacter sp.]